MTSVSLLLDRECGRSIKKLPKKCFSSPPASLIELAEDKAATCRLEEMQCALPPSVRSTFLMAFSPDGLKVASTHADHNICVCDVRTGKLLHTLKGHPRTPWCLSFHPTSNDILASGCLGGEVRVWDLHGGSEVWVADQKPVITSLAFHPNDKVLVIATLNQLHFWDWSLPAPFATCETGSEKEKVRFVKFDSQGTHLITGITNVPPENLRSHVWESVFGPTFSRAPPSRTFISQRRSILSRLMSMYRHLEGLEGTSSTSARSPSSPPPSTSSATTSSGQMSPTHDDALQRARVFAEAVSLQNAQFHRQRLFNLDQALGIRGNPTDLLDDEPGGSSDPPLHNLPQDGLTDDDPLIPMATTSSTPPPAAPPPPPLGASESLNANADFWVTFHRLRFICSSLERRMQQQPPPSLLLDLSPLPPPPTFPDAASIPIPAPPIIPGSLGSLDMPDFARVEGLSLDGPSAPDVSLSLVNLLTRLQHSLQSLSNAALTTAVAREQIQQVRTRISEILERLANVSGYRARLTNLRDQIYEAADRMAQRGEDNTPTQRWDLAYCLWLVEMSLQLTRQMQRILAADYRLTQLHLTTAMPTTTSNPSSTTTSTITTTPPNPLLNSTTTTSTSLLNTMPSNPSNNNTSTSYLASIWARNNPNRDTNTFTIAALDSPVGETNRSRIPNPLIDRGPFSLDRGRIARGTQSWHSSETSPFLWRFPPVSLDPVGTNRRSGTDPMRNPRSALDIPDLPPIPSSILSAIPRTTLARETTDASTSTSFSGFQGRTTSARSPGRVITSATRIPRSSAARRRWFNYRLSPFVARRRICRWTSGPSGSRYAGTDYPEESDRPTSQASTSSPQRRRRETGWGDALPRSSVRNRRGTEFNSSNFVIPSVQIEPSTSPDNGSPPPLPADQRPRSPPLSAILSGAGVDLLVGSGGVLGPGGPGSSGSNSLGVGLRPGNPVSYFSLLYDSNFRRRARMNVGMESTHNITHRIQCWDFTHFVIPNIYDAESNMVVPKCKINNDASVDISRDGQLLVALVPNSGSLVQVVMLAVYSLRPKTMGQCLFTWSFENSTAISLSFSPAARYVVLGISSSRNSLGPPEREPVAQIFRLDPYTKNSSLTYVSSVYQEGGTQQLHSLNCVRWLPASGQGLIYGTNRGLLLICRPISSSSKEGQRASSLQLVSTSTQTSSLRPEMNTTGTQTNDNRP